MIKVLGIVIEEEVYQVVKNRKKSVGERVGANLDACKTPNQRENMSISDPNVGKSSKKSKSQK